MSRASTNSAGEMLVLAVINQEKMREDVQSTGAPSSIAILISLRRSADERRTGAAMVNWIKDNNAIAI